MQKFQSCGAQVEKDLEGIKNSGWQKTEMQFGPPALFTDLNYHLSADLSQ